MHLLDTVLEMKRNVLYLTEATLTVSFWSGLADNEAERLASEVTTAPIIGLCELHASRYHGFSLSSSKSTLVSFDPVGERPDALRAWRTNNAAVIEARRLRVEEAKCSNAIPETSTIKEMVETKVENVVYDKNIRLKIFITEFNKQNLHVFVGCNLCGKKCDHENNTSFDCDVCGRPSVGEYRMFFNFKATDGSETKTMSAYNEVAEKMLQINLEDFLQMNHEETTSFYEETALRFRTKPTCIQLIPVPPPTPDMPFIKWVVKDVINEECYRRKYSPFVLVGAVS